ncbi:hypothetical protein DIURU_002367 [Diutina rugosa]|uniref:OPT family small oligopeptide transporter n=1 Tax=Diutina rugosa TaxID=5481 RepID=A0A642UQA1_DIURU|nr:uncharacterized protein DIURU_002367 [Diutina rugosa]KAA8903481.1 hypothetical protein DIURU_002367 [Diutina rugosa]
MAEDLLNTIKSSGTIGDPSAHEVKLDEITSHQYSLGEVGAHLTAAQKKFVLLRLNYHGLDALNDLPADAVFIIDKVDSLSIDEAVKILKQAVKDHDDDYNIVTKDMELWERLISHEHSSDVPSLDSDAEKSKGDVYVSENLHGDILSEDEENFDYTKIIDWNFQARLEATIIAFWSPYVEVRSVTDPFDDPSLPAETLRVYIIGTIWTGLGAVINTFFNDRQPSIGLGTSVVQVLLYPCGLLAAAILPKWNIGFGKYKMSLNPGPWNYKEQLLCTLFYSVSSGTPYVFYTIQVQRMPAFYGQTWVTFGYEVLIMLSSQFMGFGFAGLLRKFVVFPVQCMWPTQLPTLALNKTLMKPAKKERINGWTISAYKFFFICFVASFLYFWVPNYLMPFLSTFNWISWIKPTDIDLVNITGSNNGLGLNPITSFDWNVINMGNPLSSPLLTSVTNYIGAFLSFFIIVGIYYSNYKWTAYIPINSNRLWTNKGKMFKVTSVLNKQSLFDNDKYLEVGPPFYSAANLFTYGVFFAIYLFSVVYEFGSKWRQIWHSLKLFYKSLRNWRTSSVFDGFDDPFTNRMKRYKEVPEWAFTIILVISTVLSIICVQIYPARTPVWTIFFALALNLVFLVPLTILVAVTGSTFALNVLIELIIGYALPGNGLALMYVKAIGTNIDSQAQTYISDQKLTHYASIPPRALFRCQLLSTFICCFISLGMMEYLMTGIPDYCEPDNKQKFTCPGSGTYYSASVIWGVIGPQKSFKLYPIFKWCFLIGACVGALCLAFKLYGPRRITRKFQPTVLLMGMMIWAPYNLSYYTMGLYFSLIFMGYIRSRMNAWWAKYNYILSAGLTAGVAFSSIIIYFAVYYHDKSIDWWGSEVSYFGYEGKQGALLNATLQAPDGYFGPRKGNFPT